MVRALERPPAPNSAALEDLQGRAVVLVRRALIGGEQPPAVRRHVGDRLPRQALEVLAHDRDALGRSVGFLVVDRLHAGIELLEHVVAQTARRRPAVRIGSSRATAGERCRSLPSAGARGCGGPGRGAGSGTSSRLGTCRSRRWARRCARGRPRDGGGSSRRPAAGSRGCSPPCLARPARRVRSAALRRRSTRTGPRALRGSRRGRSRRGPSLSQASAMTSSGSSAGIRPAVASRETRRRRCGPTFAAARGRRALRPLRPSRFAVR